MSDQDTLAWYEAKAPDYAHNNTHTKNRHIDAFLDRLAPGTFILELGCGSGRDAAYMLERGFNVDPTDGTFSMVQEANLRYAIGARQMRFDELEAVAKYDAVWAHACLLHLHRADLPQVLKAIYAALRPGGFHYANYKLGDAEHPDEGKDPLGRWANLPSPQWLQRRYCEAGLTIVETERFRGNGSDGVHRDWLALTGKKQ